MSADSGRPFWKMSGSGNDFVFFDARRDAHAELRAPAAIERICDRRQGVGADGVVFLEAAASSPASFRMAYFNGDGSRASMCGNAALCSTRLATDLGAAPPTGFVFASDAGPVDARIRDGQPEVDLSSVQQVTADIRIDLEAGEQRIGVALVGVPHVVVLCADVDPIPLPVRGRALRHHPWLGTAGANANFVSPDRAGGWRMRTFERGVEAETLACGTGAVACAVVLGRWGLSAPDHTRLVTRSGRELHVRLRRAGDGGQLPSLRGEGRIVYGGQLHEL